METEHDEGPILENIQALRISQEWRHLLIEAIESGVKLSLGNVVRIWTIGEGRIPGRLESFLPSWGQVAQLDAGAVGDGNNDEPALRVDSLKAERGRSVDQHLQDVTSGRLTTSS
jgi:hypothetical protein